MPVFVRWGEKRLVVQEAGRWHVLAFPRDRGRHGTVRLYEGDGTAVPEPFGPRLAICKGDTLSILDPSGHASPVPLPARGPIRDAAWETPRSLLAVLGRNALQPGILPGPSLKPPGPGGVTARHFGDVPEEGPTIWRLPLSDASPTPLVTGDGASDLRSLTLIPGRGVTYERYRYPVYGSPSFRRIGIVPDSSTQSAGFRPFADAPAPWRTDVDPFPDLPGETRSLAVSPDGHSLALLHSDFPETYPFWYRLMVLRQDTWIEPLPQTLRITGETPSWSPDGNAVAVTAFDGIRVGIVVAYLMTSTWRWLGPTEGAQSHVLLGPRGREAWALWSGPDDPPVAIQVSEHGREPLPDGVWDRSPSASATGGQEARSRIFAWESAGHRLEGLLLIPEIPGLTPERSGSRLGPWPLVVDLHGGPIQGLRAAYSPRLRRWASDGFAVFAPDYSGSGIAGRERMEETFAGRGEAIEERDVLRGVDALVSGGVADPQRLFLYGHSHGGSLVNRIVTLDARFRAAVSFEGHADARLMYCLTWGGGGLASARSLLGGSPWQVPKRYAAESPVDRAAAVQTPILLVSGDHTATVADSLLFLTALTAHGKEVEWVSYEGEGHVLMRAENRDDLHVRALDWFRRHDPGSKSESAAEPV